ncbi:MAG: ferrous iron transport protein B [Bacteroidota bacterium]
MRGDSPETLQHHNHHTHVGVPAIASEKGRLTVLLVGNPNVGKSLFFNYLSGLYVDVSNYPGTTVEIVRGRYRNYDVFDTPGIYGVSSFNDEERAARDLVLQADVVIDIVDAVHLERDLFLTQQLIDMGKKVVVALNMMDEAKKHRVSIDVEGLSEILGVPVVPTVATTKQGFDRLELTIAEAREGKQNQELHAQLHELLAVIGSQAEALLVLEGDPYVAERHGVPPLPERERIYIDRRNRVNDTINRVLREETSRGHISAHLGRWVLRPLTGIPTLVLMMYLAYLFVGKVIAQDVVDFTESQLGNDLWEPWIRSIIEPLVSQSTWLGTILIGEFGVLTMTVTYLLFLLLPLVIAFYIALSLLEDSGYLPRLATMVDRIMNFLGLNGRAVIPLILGFGCITMATVTTRLLGSEREKTIATTILQFAIPCSAQLAVIAALLARAGFIPMLIYIAVLVSVLVTIGTTLNFLMKGSTTPLLIDLPPMRLPRLDNVTRKTAIRTYYFMKEATPWFFVGALAVGIMQVTGMLELWQELLTPLTTKWLQLPREAAMAFVMGLVRRDFGAAGLYALPLSPMQVVVALLTITLFVPCIASLMVMMKERGVREALLIWAGTWVIAFSVGGIVSQLLI